MSPTYPGSAGGQPRLTLPFTSLNPQDPKFAQKFEAITRTLTTWANSLLLGSSGASLAGYANYTATIGNNTTVNPVTWSAGLHSFSYFNGAEQLLQSFPTASVSLLLYGYENTPVVPSGADVREVIQIFDSTGSAITNSVDAAYRYEDSVGGIAQDFQINPVGFTFFDSANLPGTPPFHFLARVANLTTIGAQLTIYSWSK